MEVTLWAWTPQPCGTTPFKLGYNTLLCFRLNGHLLKQSMLGEDILIYGGIGSNKAELLSQLVSQRIMCPKTQCKPNAMMDALWMGVIVFLLLCIHFTASRNRWSKIGNGRSTDCTPKVIALTGFHWLWKEGVKDWSALVLCKVKKCPVTVKFNRGSILETYSLWQPKFNWCVVPCFTCCSKSMLISSFRSHLDIQSEVLASNACWSASCARIQKALLWKCSPRGNCIFALTVSPRVRVTFPLGSI